MTFNSILFHELVTLLTRFRNSRRLIRPIGPPISDIAFNSEWSQLFSRVKREEFTDIKDSLVIFEPSFMQSPEEFDKGCVLTSIASSLSPGKLYNKFFNYTYIHPFYLSNTNFVKSLSEFDVARRDEFLPVNNDDIKNFLKCYHVQLRQILIISNHKINRDFEFDWIKVVDPCQF